MLGLNGKIILSFLSQIVHGAVTQVFRVLIVSSTSFIYSASAFLPPPPHLQCNDCRPASCPHESTGALPEPASAGIRRHLRSSTHVARSLLASISVYCAPSSLQPPPPPCPHLSPTSPRTPNPTSSPPHRHLITFQSPSRRYLITTPLRRAPCTTGSAGFAPTSHAGRPRLLKKLGET